MQGIGPGASCREERGATLLVRTTRGESPAAAGSHTDRRWQVGEQFGIADARIAICVLMAPMQARLYYAHP